jgi:outer membrane lipoprotein SlyB
MKRVVIFLCLVIGLILGGCTSTRINQSKTQALHSGVKWGVAPLVNYTQTPQAGEKAAAITAGLLQVYDVKQVVMYKRPGSCKTILACPHQQLSTGKIRAWARSRRISYVMYGSVNEWRYKVGLDGEPAVSVTLSVLDVYSGRVVWNSVGSKVGGSRGSVGVIAHDLISSMLSGLVIRRFTYCR